MKISLAIDGATQSAAAIHFVKNLGLNVGQQIVLISVVDLSMPMAMDIYGGYLPDMSEFEKAAKENAARILSDAAATLRKDLNDEKTDIRTELLFGTPESRIVEFAEEIKPDLIIVGSHGYSGWERLLLGSVSDAVVHHAPCSVLVVRPSSC